MMADVTRRELANWPIGEPFELWPRMQEITLEAIMRVVFGPVETDRLKRLRAFLRRLTNWMNDPRRLNLLAAAGPSRFAGNSAYLALALFLGVTEAAERWRRNTPPIVVGACLPDRTSLPRTLASLARFLGFVFCAACDCYWCGLVDFCSVLSDECCGHLQLGFAEVPVRCERGAWSLG